MNMSKPFWSLAHPNSSPSSSAVLLLDEGRLGLCLGIDEYWLVGYLSHEDSFLFGLFPVVGNKKTLLRLCSFNSFGLSLVVSLWFSFSFQSWHSGWCHIMLICGRCKIRSKIWKHGNALPNVMFLTMTLYILNARIC